jgi:hypothetical protein
MHCIASGNGGDYSGMGPGRIDPGGGKMVTTNAARGVIRGHVGKIVEAG